MVKTFLKIASIQILLATSILQSEAQVTIGSHFPPQSGALLDLKQEVNPDNTTAVKGLGLPRVELTERNNLFPMFDNLDEYNGQYKKDQDAIHTGLLVYNVNDNALDGTGLYVWDGEQWILLGISKNSITVSPTTITLYNNIMNTASVEASWKTTQPPTITTSGFPFSVNPSTLSTSPATLVVTAPDMTSDELALEPYLLKTGEITLGDPSNPSATKTISVKQINKALNLVSDKIYTSSTVFTGSTEAHGNVSWKVSSILPNPLAIASVDVGSTNLLDKSEYIDWNNDDGVQGGNGIIKITATNILANQNRYNYILLTDAGPLKTFSDVTLTVLQCASTKNPTMDEWVKIASLEGVGEDVVDENTGMAWHYDQDGNIFLSSRFGYWDNGTERRWMITNLAAQNFVTTARTGLDNVVTAKMGYIKPNASHPDGQELSLPNNASYNDVPLWIYPATTSDLSGMNSAGYEDNQRNGLLYNWAAATNTKAAGVEDAPGRVSGYNRRQGICPNGWHLPSNSETVDLLNEIKQNVTEYSSSLPFSNNTPLTYTYYQLGSAMTGLSIPLKDYCSIETDKPLADVAKKATSNPISKTLKPGFNAALSGVGIRGTIGSPNKTAYYWTSSARGAGSGQAIKFTAAQDAGDIGLIECYTFMNIRCVKDY